MKPGDRVRVTISFDNIDNYPHGVARALNGAIGIVDSQYDGDAYVRFHEPCPQLPVAGSYTMSLQGYWLPIHDLKKE